MQGNLNLFKLILDSDIVVKFVILLLFSASLYSWAIFFQKKKEWSKFLQLNREFLDIYRTTSNLNELLRKTREMSFSPYSFMFQKGYEEFLKISDKLGGNKSREFLVKHFEQFGFGLIERSLKQGSSEANEKLETYLSVLASLGSICPFVGLFGTVWGVMNAMNGMSSAQGNSLDAVAPGIAEALFTTAIGLAAAIPAVVFYNYFSNETLKMNGKMESFGQEFLNMVERSLANKN